MWLPHHHYPPLLICSPSQQNQDALPSLLSTSELETAKKNKTADFKHKGIYYRELKRNYWKDEGSQIQGKSLLEFRISEVAGMPQSLVWLAYSKLVEICRKIPEPWAEPLLKPRTTHHYWQNNSDLCFSHSFWNASSCHWHNLAQSSAGDVLENVHSQ